MKNHLKIFVTIVFAISFNICNSQSVSKENKGSKADSVKRAQMLEYLSKLRWWEEASKKPNSWFKTDEAKQMAENILSWQDNGTGWPLMNTTLRPFTGDSSIAGPWGVRAALIKASVNEMRFLARGYTATNDERYKKAILGGLNFILEAQYESGGWPHSYPYKMTGYSHYATFNDHEISDIMTFLQDVMASPDFKVIIGQDMERVKKAYEKGLEFILNSQIVVDGKKTAWPQQCDEVTYEPKQARKFEPAAISGGESSGVLLFLMSIRKPSPEVIEAVEAGVQWYHDVQIDGLEVVGENGDVVVKPNASASPLWARYYEIGTNKPIFAGRDGIVRYNMAEIELERRKGYRWYNDYGLRVFERYKDWKYERKWDKQPPLNIDESKVVEYTLPDLMIMENGKKVKSASQWDKKRRPEILDLLEEYEYGVTPKTKINTTFTVIEKDVPGMNGKSKRTQVRITFPDFPDGPVIRVCVNVPAKAEGPVPTLLHISFSPNVLLYNEEGIDEDMAWDVRLEAKVPDREAYLLKDIDPGYFIDNGYGIATVYYGDIEPDFDHNGQYGITGMFNKKGERMPNEWGAIGAWAWGLSRVMDYLQTDSSVDTRQIALSGVSRLGKTTIWTAAQDQRFAMAIPMLSGEGGAAISRRNYGETVADLTNPFRYDYWFAPRYADYAFNVQDLPVDGHMLVSLIAPRPILQIVGSKDYWSDPKGEWVSAKAAEPVYLLYDLKGVEKDEIPEKEEPILNDMGYYMHDGIHTVLPGDFKVIVEFMDLHFKSKVK